MLPKGNGSPPRRGTSPVHERGACDEAPARAMEWPVE